MTPAAATILPALPLLVEAGHGGAFQPVALLVGLLLLLANGFFVAAEIALLAARRARIEERAEAGDPRAVRALGALRELSVTFSGAQLGITMASLGLGAVAEPAVASLLSELMGGLALNPTMRAVLAFAVALSIVVFLHMVVGEMAPKNLALARAEEVSLRVARLFGWFVTLFRPLIVGLNATANGLIRLVGVEPVDEQKLVHSPDELLLALRESRRHGTVQPQDARVMSAVLRLAEIDAEAAMTPRVDLVALPAAESPERVLAVAGETGLTRLPVYLGDLDRVIGIVNVKDVLIRDPEELEQRTLTDLLRPLPAVPESRDLERLLHEMRTERLHAVLVVDEYGGTAGLVTLEDVLEELLGEIEDEFDTESAGADHPAKRVWIVPGTLRRDELRRLTGCELTGGEAETVSGVVTERLGRLVRRGDRIETEDGWRLRVVDVGRHRAAEVEVLAPEGWEPPAGEDGGAGPTGVATEADTDTVP